ncbi:hypothetical protein VTI28DRAFT_8187 [Corynascus sepedonium]
MESRSFEWLAMVVEQLGLCAIQIVHEGEQRMCRLTSGENDKFARGDDMDRMARRRRRGNTTNDGVIETGWDYITFFRSTACHTYRPRESRVGSIPGCSCILYVSQG